MITPPLNLSAAKTILVLRTDAIGDNVLATALLDPLRAAFPAARLIYACQDRAAELFAACPLIDEVIAFSRGRAYADEGYRQQIIEQLRARQPDAILNPMFTREPLADSLVRHSGAPVRAGFSMTALPPGCTNDAYTHLIQPQTGRQLELHRIAEFLRAISVPVHTPKPRLWLTADDESFAATLIANHGLHPAKTVILFAGAGAEYRINRSLASALARAMPGTSVISVGAAHEFALHEELLNGSAARSLRHINLCGRTTLLQTAALLKKARLALGAETGSAHLACAVGTPNVIVLGGGHFGRFMPWSPLTSAACLPLSCYQCNWHCTQRRAHCVQDITADTIAAAITHALKGPSAKPRLIVQQPSHDAPPAAVADFLPESSVEILPAPPAPIPLTIAHPPRVLPRETPSPFTVTAIVSTYNNARFIKGCVQDLTDQTLFAKGQLEILVIDSASLENEAAIVREFQQIHGSEKIRYERSPLRETLYAAWNRGIDLARGKYLTSANTDDRHHPDMLALLAATLDENPQHILAYADGALTHDANAPWQTARRVRPLSWPDYSRDALFAKCFIGPHPMWRRDVHAQLGYFDATMRVAGDYEFWLRLSLHHSFIHVPQTLGLMYENFDGLSLANGGITWYESRLARERYWNTAWGPNPGLAHISAVFADLRNRAATLPTATRFAIFGAGQHTHRYLTHFRAALAGIGEIVAILDDHAAAGRSLGDLPVVQTERWRLHNIHAIIVSSDTYEKALAARAIAATPRHIPVLTLYKPELGRPAIDLAAALES